MFSVVVLRLLRDAYGLGKEARVVCEVECAGQETALLEDVGDVAKRAGMARVDVYHLWCGGGGTCGGWWKAAGCFLHKAGNGDAVSVGSVVPFYVSELSEI